MQWRAMDDCKKVWRRQQWRYQLAPPDSNSTGRQGCEMKVQRGENWGWREPNFSWCWGGGDTTHRSSLPLVPPSLCSAIQIPQPWICEVVWDTPHGQNKTSGNDLGQDCHLFPTQALHKERTMSLLITFSQPLCWLRTIRFRWALIPQCLSLLCCPRWARRCKALGLTQLTVTQISLWDPC